VKVTRGNYIWLWNLTDRQTKLAGHAINGLWMSNGANLVMTWVLQIKAKNLDSATHVDLSPSPVYSPKT